MDYFNQVISIALPNKYTKWYLSICRTAAQRSKSRKEARGKLGYTEAHHILPKSFNLGGRRDPTNLVYLNAKEHFICHRLLMKMFINPDFRAKMSYALWLMVNTRGLRISARRYAQVRESMVGRVLPEGVRLKIKAARAKQVICHSEETKEKMAASNRGQRRSEAARKNMSKPRPSICGAANPNYGQTVSEETRKKMSLGRSGGVWMTDLTTYKTQVVQQGQVLNYTQQGWVRGRIRPND